MGVTRPTYDAFPLAVLLEVSAPVLVETIIRVPGRNCGEPESPPGDDPLEVGCEPAGSMAEQPSHLRHVTGLDASEI